MQTSAPIQSGISAFETARKDIADWRATHPTNYAEEPHFLYIMKIALQNNLPRLHAFGNIITKFGKTVATEIRPLADEYCRAENAPRLRRTDTDGNLVNNVILHPLQKEVARRIWETGIIKMTEKMWCSHEQAMFLYLFSHLGEIGQACQFACTIGALRAIRRHGGEIRSMFMPFLSETDYDHAWIAAQFVTELQGGSDAGANEVFAMPEGDGQWRVVGRKFFCSVAHADLFLVTARPRCAKKGTSGLALFAVPRHLKNGSTNNFEIVRLKPKIGTTALPTGEFEFKGAVGYPVGAPNDGFKILMDDVIDTSRFFNAVANAGIMRGAYLEALLWAKHRSAFGHKLIDFPDVSAQLAEMKAEWLAVLYSGVLLAGLDEKKDCGSLNEDEALLYRFLVNANKYAAARQCTKVVHMALRLMGGSGAIEDFSVLPRLFVDSLVYELWEGGENVLAKQVMKDTAKNGMHELCAIVVGMTKHIPYELFGPVTNVALGSALQHIRSVFLLSADDPQAYGALHFARNMERLVWIIQAARAGAHCSSEVLSGEASVLKELEAATRWIVRVKLTPEYRPEDDPDYPRLINDILGTDTVRLR